MIVDILEIGDPLLRATSEDISVANLADYLGVFDNLVDTLSDAWWVGISAPQIGILKNIFVIRLKSTKNYGELASEEPQFIINPKIIASSQTKSLWREWCLSIPGSTPASWLKGKVPRHDWIEVEYIDEKWTLITRKIEWFEAIVFQHEFDHLRWILFLDRMTSLESLCTYEWFLKNR